MPDILKKRCTDLIESLGLGHPSDVSEVTPLSGGVASDIARVVVGGKSYCVKFALEKLRVAADWHAPVHRSHAEYAWLSVAGRVAPGSAPELHGYSEAGHGFAMSFVTGADVRLWKTSLLNGDQVRNDAARVADVLGRVHAAGAAANFDRSLFNNSADFHAIRVEPYLLFTAQRHPSVAPRLLQLAASLDAARTSLVHGDVSPKNILLRADQPILLDAECASMGDPCFDVAFCLNHLILKSVHLAKSRARLRESVLEFWQAYAPHVGWEDPSALEVRTAALLPALMLARIDGKSPVEYLSEPERAWVRAKSLSLLEHPEERLRDLVSKLSANGIKS
jgi:aminoglycoside phosphotransferase (APT) family kinase protein